MAEGKKEAKEQQEQAEDRKAEGGRNLDLLLDIPLEVTVELGRTKMALRDLLNLSRGAVIELNKEASEPLDILVNQQPVARGEVVVMEEKFGVRITEIATPAERVEKLK
ncbi:MAG TPA: flagellar motor switch protein FliN [Deltaproteobacteria bacterium]|nr:flagellar motor switch protein FliN [Deltaproteobacteria bacterium]